jgi:hypothetical protein
MFLLCNSIRDLVELIRDSLHVLEDNTMYVPAALAKLAYAPGDALRRKVGGHSCKHCLQTCSCIMMLVA